jgi:hypothetical protein
MEQRVTDSIIQNESSPGSPPLSLSERTLTVARKALAGRRRGLGSDLALVGPAVIAFMTYRNWGM